MAIGVTARISLATGVAATSHSTAAFTPTANELLVVAFNLGKGSADPAIPTVSGHDAGTAWLLIANNFWDTIGAARWRQCVYACITGASPGSAAVTFDYAGVTHSANDASVFEVSGADEANGLAQTFVQEVFTAPNPTNATSASLTLAAAGNAGNRAFSVWSHLVDEGKTPRTNWTEIHDVSHPNVPAGTETQWRDDAFETTASASWATSSTPGGIAFEIKAAVIASLLLRRNPMRHMLVR